MQGLLVSKKINFLTIFFIIMVVHIYWRYSILAQSAGAVEYADCFSAEGQGTTNEWPRYNTKQSDAKT